MKLSFRLAREIWSVHTSANKSFVQECRHLPKSVTRKACSKTCWVSRSFYNEKHFSKLDLFIHHKTSINFIKDFKSCNKILRSYDSLDFAIHLMALLLKPFAFLFVQMFCIKVSWSDGTVNLIYRRYSEFLHIQVW